jgi:hypothetical protein
MWSSMCNEQCLTWTDIGALLILGAGTVLYAGAGVPLSKSVIYKGNTSPSKTIEVLVLSSGELLPMPSIGNGAC